MKKKIILEASFLPAETRKTINWAHGTSTELFVYPLDGDFVTRDFTFRISTATVEADETTFSSFPAITRILMILEGKLTLIHEGRYTKHLNTFDQDTFMGDWDTKSQGRVRDFNLMCKNGAKGKVEHQHLSESEQLTIAPEGNYQYFFVAEGAFSIDTTTLRKGDTLVVKDPSSDLFVTCMNTGDLVFGSVWL